MDRYDSTRELGFDVTMETVYTLRSVEFLVQVEVDFNTLGCTAVDFIQVECVAVEVLGVDVTAPFAFPVARSCYPLAPIQVNYLLNKVTQKIIDLYVISENQFQNFNISFYILFYYMSD